MADEEKDGGNRQFLEWYVKEQEEEEESSERVRNLVRDAGEDKSALAAADRELGERMFKFPRGLEIFP
jgi:ferritin